MYSFSISLFINFETVVFSDLDISCINLYNSFSKVTLPVSYTHLQTKTITLPNVNATVNLTMDIKEATVSTATATQVLIGAEIRATDIVRVAVSYTHLGVYKRQEYIKLELIDRNSIKVIDAKSESCIFYLENNEIKWT